MWTENRKIHEALCHARSNGLTVRHRVSIPDFERFLGHAEAHKDKPLNAYLQIKSDDGLALRVQTLMDSLLRSEEHCSFGNEADHDEYMKRLLGMVSNWAADHDMAEDIRFKIQE
jgi:hypothetical protein